MKFLILSFGIPIILAFLPLATQNYRPQPPDCQVACWISTSALEPKWRNTAGSVEIFLLEVIPWLLTTIWITYVVCRVRSKLAEVEQMLVLDEDVRKHVNIITYYPIILTICWVPVMGKRVIEIISLGHLQFKYFNLLDIPIVNL